MLINSVQTCLEVANIIRDTGFPNYRVARIPLVSDLVIKAWECHLRDYPDKILINYLKFGFPLSINDHTKLANTKVNNYASALHFPDALAKEKDCGAMLGPVDKVNSLHYHCSPILTRPKDGNKRRVIVNLSYPPGQSLNDQVTRDMFDNRPFTLKFPKIEDIVDQILITEDPMLFKIDVARAFRNLRADPVDAVKLAFVGLISGTLILKSHLDGLVALPLFRWWQMPYHSSWPRKIAKFLPTWTISLEWPPGQWLPPIFKNYLTYLLNWVCP